MRVKILGIAALAFVFGACSEPLIGGRGAPDELSVIDGPPLSLPPDFELRPPLNEKEARKKASSGSDAREVLTGIKKKETTAPVDDWLMQKAGGHVDENIREKLESEYDRQQEEDDGWLPNFFDGDDENEAEEDGQAEEMAQ